jgi:hypothetical protein
MKFTKQHQKMLGLLDWEIDQMKQNGYTGIVMYETNQFVLDQWVLAYYGTNEGLTGRHANDMSLAIAEGRARKPMTLEF